MSTARAYVKFDVEVTCGHITFPMSVATSAPNDVLMSVSDASAFTAHPVLPILTRRGTRR